MTQLPEGVSIVRLDDEDKVARYRAGFIGAYQTIFSGFPYFERFYPSEAEGVYQRLTSLADNITLVAVKGEKVVGLASAIPLRAKPDVAQELTGLVPIARTFYLAELGVLDDYRGKQLGRALIRERIRLIPAERNTHVVLRVSMNNNPSAALYRSLGFEEMGVYMEVSAMRTDGRVTTDRRQFMSKLLSAVSMD